jgi:hypothetical protein
VASYGVHSFVYTRCRCFFYIMVSDCRWSLLTLIGCCQQWQQVSDTVANDRTLLTARGQAFLPLAGQRLRVLPVRITRRNGQCLKLEGLAVHVNCATKRGQAFLRVAGRSVASSDLVSGHKTCHKWTSKAGTLNREYSHAPLNDVSVNDVPHIRRLAHKIIYFCSPSGAAAQRGPRPPHSWGF